MKRKLYDDLGISPGATPDDIKKAYRKKAAETHPDKGGTSDAFHQIQLAYDVLSDQERRARYDKTGDAAADEPDNMTAKIYMMIGDTIAQVLEIGAKAGLDAANFDLLDCVVEEFERRLADANGKVKVLERTRDKFAEVQRRISRKKRKAPNVLSIIIAGRINMANGFIRKHQENIDLLTAAQKLVSDHKYNWEQPVEIPRAFSTFSIFGAKTP